MEGTTYLGRLILGVALDSGLMEGTSSPEPLEQSVRNTLSASQPEEGTTEETSDWHPVAHPFPKITLDGRFMEGTTYLEHSVLGVSLDSGLMEGTSSPEPLEQSVLNTLSAARPEEGTTEEISGGASGSENYPGRLTYGGDYLPRAFGSGVSLDRGLMEGTWSLEPLKQSVLNDTLSAARPEEGITEQLSDREPVALPVPDITLDGRPMEGTTYLDHSALGCLWKVDRWRGCRVWNHSSSRFLVCLPVYYGGDVYDAEDTEEYDPLEMARAAYEEGYNFDVPDDLHSTP